VHAISGLKLPGENSRLQGKSWFQYQIIMENVGAVPLQIRAGFFKLIGEETARSVGSQKHPAPLKLRRSLVILPGQELMYKGFASIDGSVGSMSGGYLVRSSG
jgi:uncharacterized protein affecting Mg2+/Co2+ transport